MQQPVGQTLNGGALFSNGGAGHHCPPAGDGPDVSTSKVTTVLLTLLFLAPVQTMLAYLCGTTHLSASLSTLIYATVTYDKNLYEVCALQAFSKW